MQCKCFGGGESAREMKIASHYFSVHGRDKQWRTHFYQALSLICEIKKKKKLSKKMNSQIQMHTHTYRLFSI